MRKILFYILMALVGLLYSNTVLGQYDNLYSSRSSDLDMQLQKAASLIGQDNEKATLILSEVIQSAKDSNRREALIQAYTLLGDINENAGLFSLSLIRYEEALSYTDSASDSTIIAELYYKKGKILELENGVAAKSAYSTCMEQVVSSAVYFYCLEGVATVMIQEDSLSKAMHILDQLENHYLSRDSLDLARIQARKSIVAAAQSKMDLAIFNYSNAQSNFNPKNDKGENTRVINIAKEKMSISQNSLDDEINFRKSNISDFEINDNTNQVEDQIKLAEAYVRKGDLSNATDVITEARKAVSNNISEATKSKIYKESSEISALLGKYELALEEYKKYESAQNIVIETQKLELENKLKLLESQKVIDINAQVYDSNRKLGVSESQLLDFQKYLIYLLILLLLMALLSSLWIYKSLRENRVANKKLELKSLSAQMNPHFIFNALNSVNEYIATQDEIKANKYLTQFSKLMRKVLDVNQKDLIPITEELELTDLYLKLEHSRFEDQFDYTFDIDPAVHKLDFYISPMLLQPYIENAIWHGLRYKSTKGNLRVTVSAEDHLIHIAIQDDGIGRAESLQRKTVHQKQHKAAGMKNTAQRMNIIEALYETKYSIDITEAFPLEDDKGTLVNINLSTYG